jgi:hypothetical protein
MSDGDAGYLLIGPAQKNGSNKAIKIENYRPKAVLYTTNYLSPPHWEEISADDIPPKLLRKITEKAALAFG